MEPAPHGPRRPSPPALAHGTSPECSRSSPRSDTVASSPSVLLGATADLAREPSLQNRAPGSSCRKVGSGRVWIRTAGTRCRRRQVASQPFLHVQREWQIKKPRVYPRHGEHALSHQHTFIERLLYAPCSSG